jgi:hypothetical protein
MLGKHPELYPQPCFFWDRVSVQAGLELVILLPQSLECWVVVFEYNVFLGSTSSYCVFYLQGICTLC